VAVRGMHLKSGFRPLGALDELVRRQFCIQQLARLFRSGHRQFGRIQQAHLREQRALIPIDMLMGNFAFLNADDRDFSFQRL
jgi:hypothetical protein